MSSPATALVTGANSGVGFALCERLLTEYPDIELCLACRNKGRGEAAKRQLLASYPGAKVYLVLVDVGSLASVKKCVSEITEIFEHLDFLFLNAGIMTDPSVKWDVVLATFFQPSKLVHRFSTGADLLRIRDDTTQEGFKATFATNVLGHFYLAKELDGILGGSQPSRIVWTSSRTSARHAYNVADIQCVNGEDPYASSKYLIDSISVVMNDKLRKKNVTVNTMCPGMLISGVSLGILPRWLWWIIYPIIQMLAIIVHSFTWEPYNGAEALIWLTKRRPESLDPYNKYYSMCTVLGRRYTHLHKMDDIKMNEAEDSYAKLEEILADFKL